MSHNSKQTSPEPMSKQPHKPTHLVNRQEQQSRNEVRVKRLFWLMPLALSLNLTGCALLCPKPVPPIPCPVSQVPPAPALTLPIPSQSYSSSAQSDMAKWRESLTSGKTTQ